MTVKELIKELKSMPQDSIVAVRDHDQEESELNVFPNHVTLIDFSEIQPNIWDLNTKVVILYS